MYKRVFMLALVFVFVCLSSSHASKDYGGTALAELCENCSYQFTSYGISYEKPDPQPSDHWFVVDSDDKIVRKFEIAFKVSPIDTNLIFLVDTCDVRIGIDSLFVDTVVYSKAEQYLY